LKVSACVDVAMSSIAANASFFTICPARPS
jgi:hypothetical protein